jgi:hypothetical protein
LILPALATASPPPRPFTDADVAALRAEVERGGKPRVRLRPGTAGVAGATVGTVTSIGQPAADGPEFVRVAVRINGARDVLPFALADLDDRFLEAQPGQWS